MKNVKCDGKELRDRKKKKKRSGASRRLADSPDPKVAILTDMAGGDKNAKGYDKEVFVANSYTMTCNDDAIQVDKRRNMPVNDVDDAAKVHEEQEEDARMSNLLAWMKARGWRDGKALLPMEFSGTKEKGDGL